MKEVEFRVLGSLEVLVEGRALELTRRKRRSLLALLLLNAGEVVSTDRLIEELWAGKPPKAAVGSLQNLVSDLRKALGRETVRTREPGYVLEVDPERIDVHRFERLVAQAAEGGDARRRASLLHEALGLWRGEPLADLAFEPFAHVEIARLEELRTAAREELVEAELELGRHAQLVTELESLVSENPWRERLRGQLMLALYRSGRQAEALEAYRQARETLVDELGIEPSTELQELEQAILRHDPELDLHVDAGQAARPASEERRKTVTVLFADIVDFTSLVVALDAEVLRRFMRRYFDIVRTVVERHGGVVEKFIGDAAMAIFGIPQAHEDDALRAVRAATESRDALAALGGELEQDHGLALQIKIGIDTGEVVAGDVASGEPFATGEAVTTAVRLQQAALPGETLVGETTRAVLREAVLCEPVEPIATGGSLGTLRAFRIVGVGESTGLRPRGRARFVGRQGELGTLAREFQAARDERRSRVVLILGDAGIGKTRLTAEFVSSVENEAEALFGRCVSYGEGATYLPLAEIVAQAVGGRPQAMIAALLEGDEHAALIAEHLAELTGQGDGGASPGEVFWAARRFFEGLASRRPLVVVLEDIHWAEPTLLDLIEYLAAWVSDTPILVIGIARAELLEQRPGWASTMETISLGPLSGDDSAALLDELARESDLSDKARVRIVEVGEGNALFVEQLLAYVTEDVGPEGVEDAIPPSIDALLASRLDSLDSDDRSVLERAAVVGKHFARGAVRYLSPPETLASVDTQLASLERRGLIHPHRRPATEDGFRFHHVLIRDVAYAGITKQRRAELHERHGNWLQQRNEADELVGYHAEQAHRYRQQLQPSDPDLERLASWAGERLAAAGIRAWKHADTPATVNLLGRAAGLLPAEQTHTVEVMCELGIALKAAGRLEDSEKTLRAASRAAAGARDERMRLRAEIELAHLHLFSDVESGSAELVELAANAIPLFEELGDERALGRTWRQVGYVRGVEGRLGDWHDAEQRALVHYKRSGWSSSGCLVEVAAASFYGPTPVEEAVTTCERLLDEATDLAGRAGVLAFMGGLDGLSGRFEEARARLDDADATYEQIGELHTRVNNSGRIRGRIELLAGDAAAAERALRDCCAAFEQAHDQAGLSTSAAELADALYQQGRNDEADVWLERAEARAPVFDVSAQYTWRRVRAKLLAAAGAYSEAEALAREAALVAGGTDALHDHGRVLLDLAGVMNASGRRAEAADEVRRAVELFARKGDVVSERAARTALSELTVA